MKNFKIISTYFLLCLFFFTSLYGKNNYFKEGEKLFSKKKINESKFKFEKDIVFNPKNEKSYLYLAKIFKIQKNDEFQERNLNTVILLDPKNEEAIYLLALLKIKQSDYKKAKELISVFKKVCNNICKNEIELSETLKNLQPN